MVGKHGTACQALHKHQSVDLRGEMWLSWDRQPILGAFPRGIRIMRRPAINPGIIGPLQRTPPHPPAGTSGTGPLITFARSGITVNCSPNYGSILELAEACDVPTRFSCRSGVCHMCVTGVVAGTADYVQSPLEKPDEGQVLICSAAPRSDLVLAL